MKLFVVVIGTVLLFVRPNQACSRPPPSPTIPPSTSCPSISASDVRAGRVPLYGSRSDGNRNYIIVLKDDVDPENIKNKIDKLKSSGNKRIAESKALNAPSNGIKAVVSYLDDDELDTVRQMEGVKYVEKDVEVEASARTDVWGIDRIDQRSLPLVGYYSSTGDANNVTVYVIDSGVNTHHVKFGGRAENWHEVVTGTREDCTGHGTHVAGTVAAVTYGVATAVKIRSVRIFGCSRGTTYSSHIIEAINYILAHGEIGSVVSMSFGTKKGPSMPVDYAVKSLIQAGFVVVVSAGNSNQDACNQSPARVTEAITVGATDREDVRWSESNYGVGVDIFAPGKDIESLSNASNTGTATKSGTSMATAHVSGVAAILLFRGVPASEVRQKISDLSTAGVVRDSKGSHSRLLYIN